MTRARFLTFAALIALSGAGLTVLMAARAAGDKTADPPRPPEGGRRLVCLGYVDAKDKVVGLLPENFPQPSRVTRVLAREGQEVKDGDRLLEFDVETLNLKVAEADNAVARAQSGKAKAEYHLRLHTIQVNALYAELQAKQEELKNKKDELLEAERTQQLGRITQLAVDAARAELKAAEYNLESARIKWAGLRDEPPTYAVTEANEAINQALNAKKQAEHARNQVRLVAPADGRIVRSFVSEGTMFGLQTKEPAFWFLKKGDLIVRAEVTQEFARRVQKGMAARIEDEADDTQVWKGKVDVVPNHFLPKRLGNTGLIDIMPVTDERVLECQISIDLEGVKMPPRFGQKVRVTLGE